MNREVIDIVCEWLKANGYDGLVLVAGAVWMLLKLPTVWVLAI